MSALKFESERFLARFFQYRTSRNLLTLRALLQTYADLKHFDLAQAHRAACTNSSCLLPICQCEHLGVEALLSMLLVILTGCRPELATQPFATPPALFSVGISSPTVGLTIWNSD